MVVFSKIGCNRVKWLYSGKSGCNLAKVVVIVVVFWQKCLNSVKSGCIRVKMLCSGKVVVFGQK